MSFTSPQFLVFFVLVFGIATVFTGKVKKCLLLASSLFFIGSFNLHSVIAVVFFSSFTFIVARSLSGRKNNFLFYFSVIVNCLAIILFNYILASRGSLIFSFSAVDFKVGSFLLIIGLSFYNLQHVAYLIDVQKERVSPEKNYVDFLLISCYFPKFISGPLTLYQQLKPQLQNLQPPKEILWQGFNRIMLGFFKKMVLADRLAPSVGSIFDYNDDLPGITIIMGAILFTIQLYFDFSGYCDIAIGVSKMLGIELPENFIFPLRATSVTIFWRRWHRSLINFFTTYVFYPVSFRYRKLNKHAAAIGIFLTFFISAIWHGIGFTFMIWALCHMLYLLFELYFRKNNPAPQNKFVKLILAIMVLLLVSFSNIFFRSTTTSNCLHMLSDLFSFNFFPDEWLVDFIAPTAVGGHQADHFNLIVTILFVLPTLIFERKIFAIANSSKFRTLVTLLVIILIFLFGVFNSGQRFIYMQF